MPTLSKKTIKEFQEYFVGTTLRTIADEFDAADIAPDLDYIPTVTGERRCLFQQYMHGLDLTKARDCRKVLNLFETVLTSLEVMKNDPYSGNQEYAGRNFELLTRLLERDGFSYGDGRIASINNESALAEFEEAISPIDAPHMQQQIERLRASANDDPWLAIGTAKELIETVAKIILRERGQTLPGKPEIPELMKAVRQSLQLLPDQIPDSAKGAETIRRMLSNLGTIAQNLAELRRDYGTGHGHDGNAKGLEPRHARLAVNAAVTLVTFLVETHRAKLANPRTDSV